MLVYLKIMCIMDRRYLIVLEKKIWLELETDHLSLQSFIESLMFLGCYLDIQSFTVLYEAQALGCSQ